MKKYLNAKLILFKKLLKKRKFLITDSQIKEFPILKKISKIRGLKLLDIKDQNKIINDTSPIFIGILIKKFSYGSQYKNMQLKHKNKYIIL